MARRLLLAVVGLVALTLAAHADYVEVRRSATIKADHNGDAEVWLRPAVGDLFALEPIPGTPTDQRDCYYQVHLPDGRLGWIYRTLVRRHPGALPGGGSPTIPSSGSLEVHVMDVGQADAILIRCPDGIHQMLIDAGDNRYRGSSRQFKAYMEANQAKTDEIEVVIATHPHADHIGSMAWVLREYPVGLYVDNGNVYDSATYRRVDTAWEEREPAYWSAQDEVTPIVDFCSRSDVSAQLLVTDKFGHHDDPNDNSVIVRVDYGESSFLFVGDAEGVVEDELIGDPDLLPLLDVDFLKVGHHGSDTSSSQAFLDAVTPDIAVISCGERGVSTNSRYKHPRHSTVTRLMGLVEARQGPTVPIDAFDGVADQWRSVRLDRALYTTVGVGNLVFESDGHVINRTNPD